MSRDTVDVDHLTKQFLCCTPINRIILATCEQFLGDVSVQKKILDCTVNNDVVKVYPLKRAYQKAFLKFLMEKIENNGGEIHDEIYTAYCDLVSLSDKEAVHYRHFLIDDGILNRIILQESTNIISEGTTGLCSWQGAVALADWCKENKSELHGKTILELGCGVGLSGLSVISTCLPKRYVFSDCHEVVLDMVCRNIKLNLLNSTKHELPDIQPVSNRIKLQIKYNDIAVEVIQLNWEDVYKYINENPSLPDVIVAADILYESNSFQALTKALKSFLSFNTEYAVIAATIRNADTVQQFLDHLGHHDLAFEDCAVPRQTISIQLPNVPIRILKIYRKS